MVNQTPAQIEAYTELKKTLNLSKCGGGREVNLMKQPQHSNNIIHFCGITSAYNFQS